MTGYRHHGVPYVTQWTSPEDVRAIVEDGADPCADPSWRSSGFETPDEFRFWARRICGLACLESVLRYWDIAVPTRAEMLRLAITWRAYRRVAPDRVDGLIYRQFAEWVESDFGLRAEVYGTLSAEDLPSLVDASSLVITSVSSEIRYPTRPNLRRGGHLVLVHGWNDGGLIFHNPSGIPPYQADAYVDWATFERFYAGRGVVLRRGAGGG